MDQNRSQENQVVNIEDFEQINLVHEVTGILYKVQPNRKLAIRDNILNPMGYLNIKGEGLNLIVPGLQDAYIVDTTTYSVTLKDKTDDGKYEQDIGLGKDAKLSIKTTFAVGKDPAAISRLVKQKDSYLGAVRKTCEIIMRLSILRYIKQNGMDGHEEVDLSKYYDIGKITLDLIAEAESIRMGTVPADDEITLKIVNEVAKLYVTYGIKLTNINIVDMDLPEEIKRIISENRDAAAARQRQAEQAKIDREIAKNEAIAQRIKYETEYNALKKAGLNQEQIAEIIGRKYLPKDTVAVLNSVNNNDRVSDIVTGVSAAKKMK